MKRFSLYLWPGNVRELRNVLERSMIVCPGDYIEESHLPPLSEPSAAVSPLEVMLPIGTTVEEAEKRLIYRTLEFTQNNKTRAASILGISLKTLHNKLNSYGTEAND